MKHSVKGEHGLLEVWLIELIKLIGLVLTNLRTHELIDFPASQLPGLQAFQLLCVSYELLLPDT